MLVYYGGKYDDAYPRPIPKLEQTPEKDKDGSDAKDGSEDEDGSESNERVSESIQSVPNEVYEPLARRVGIWRKK